MDPLLCRICLSRTGAISVFKRESDDIQYSTKIMRLISVEVSEDDGLPNLLCGNCVKDLSNCYQFVMKCEASDRALRCVQASNMYYDDAPSNTTATEDTKNDSDSNDFNNDFSPESPVKCSTEEINDDESKLVTQKGRRQSVKKKSKDPSLECVVCGYMAMSSSALQAHIRIHTGEKPFPCDVCSTSFRTRGALKRHSETFHLKRERTFICEICGNSFYRKNDIITHIRVHTDERPYVCPYCPKKFRQIATMIRHRRIHTGEKPYSCTICGKKFADSTLVRKHQSVHTEEKKFQCHLCPKLVKTQSALNAHIKVHTKGKPNHCNICGMSFNVKGNLRNHMSRVHSEKSGACSICQKTFSDIEVHMRKHTGEKPFVCEICNAAFGLKRCLAHHMLFKHENAAKYKCSVGECTKTFPTATMLEFHLLKQHTNHTPYICQHCSRGFFRASDLSRHLRVSHMDAPKTPLKSLTLKLDVAQFTCHSV